MIAKEHLRALAKEGGMRLSKEVPEILENHALAGLKVGMLRAKKNGRSTVLPHDLPVVE